MCLTGTTAAVPGPALSALRALERRAEISPARSAEAVSDLLSVPIRRYSTEALAGRIWSMRHTVTAYDAHYVALAEVLGAPLLTGNRTLAAAAGELVEIHWFNGSHRRTDRRLRNDPAHTSQIICAGNR